MHSILAVYGILTLILSLFVHLLSKEMEDRRELQCSLAKITLNLAKRIDELEKSKIKSKEFELFPEKIVSNHSKEVIV
tara:strand:- start:1130 stop:1363 length:234 start_codon:yes stop_codon:yes gene_type:complete